MKKTMMTKKISLLCLLSVMLTACNGFFDKDNTPAPTPLMTFPQQIYVRSLWNVSAGNGARGDYIKLVPAVTSRYVFTAGQDGTVTAIDKCSGRLVWRVLTSVNVNAGPGANDGVVVIGGHNGEVVALREIDGRVIWQNCVSSEILAPPAVNNGVVIVKSIDGNLTAFSQYDGRVLWRTQQSEPVLILRSGSTPFIYGDNVIAGFANGNLLKLSLRNGSTHWLQPIGIPEGNFMIQRMVDIDSDPVVYRNRLFAATYQGRVAALDPASGRFYWSQNISSYMGIAVDDEHVYVSDARSHIWAFNAYTGRVEWQQCMLESRNISGPAVLGNYIVVGDQEGYLHWMNKQDGHFVARLKVGGYAVRAAPVVDNNVLYVLTVDGRVAAYTLLG